MFRNHNYLVGSAGWCNNLTQNVASPSPYNYDITTFWSPTQNDSTYCGKYFLIMFSHHVLVLSKSNSFKNKVKTKNFCFLALISSVSVLQGWVLNSKLLVSITPFFDFHYKSSVLHHDNIVIFSFPTKMIIICFMWFIDVW